MKSKMFLVFFIIFYLFQVAYSQNIELSDSVRTLSERIKTDGEQAILDAGKSGDKSLIPYLKTLIRQHKNVVQMALARLGDEESLNQIISELESSNIATQNSAIRKLAYVANKKALKKLFQLLDETKERGEKECKSEVEEFKGNNANSEKCGFCCDIMIFSLASEVVRVLSQTIKNPPIKSYYGSEKDILIWKKWFEEHKELIE